MGFEHKQNYYLLVVLVGRQDSHFLRSLLLDMEKKSNLPLVVVLKKKIKQMFVIW